MTESNARPKIKNKYKWIAHSHVDGGVLAASVADRKTLERLHQESSIIVGIDGEETVFQQLLFDALRKTM